MKFKSILAASAVAIAAFAAPVAHAYSLTSQDVTFTMAVVDADTFTLRIQNLLNASGNWAAVTQYGALEFKEFGTATGATINPNGSAAAINTGLSANGCAQGNPQNTICFSFLPLLTVSNDDLFTVDVTGGTVVFGADGPHLKVNFMNAQGSQIGDLLSKNLPGTSVPEPASLALLGLGLLGLGLSRRKKA